SFFDTSKVGKAIRFVSLSELVLNEDLSALLKRISDEVEAASHSIVVVDSFRTLARMHDGGDSTQLALQSFLQQLAIFLTIWHEPTFLVGEYSREETAGNPLFTVCDGLFWLTPAVERNSVVRKLQIMKLRGQASVPGLHTVRITDNGL